MKEPLTRHAALCAGACLLGVLGAFVLSGEAAGRVAALLGVGLSAQSGIVALLLKSRVLSRSIGAALKLVGLLFAARLALAAVGLHLTSRLGGRPLPFAAGFFGVYFALQWIEVSYLLSERRRQVSA